MVSARERERIEINFLLNTTKKVVKIIYRAINPIRPFKKKINIYN